MASSPEPDRRTVAPAPGTVLFPADTHDITRENAAPRSRASWWWIAAVLASAGGWLIWRQSRQGRGVAIGAGGLRILETRSLGNRMFLVVAAHENRRFLLGIAPGGINLLSDLGDKNTEDETAS
jgi:hypothetical protein